MTQQFVSPAPVVRQPLGMPAGSVRAVLASMIVALFLMLLALPANKNVTVPLYLYFLLALLLPFFAEHGSSIAAQSGHPSPLWLPRGTFRLLFVLASVAIVVWQYYLDRELLLSRLTPRPEQLSVWPRLVAALVGGFLLGWVLRLGPWRRTYWYQDLVAWVSLIGMGLLGAIILFEVFANPNLSQDHRLPGAEAALVGIVAFYFGVRCP